MSDNIEMKLRESLQQDLEIKEAALVDLQQEIHDIKGKIAKFDEVFGTGPTTKASTRTGGRKPRVATGRKAQPVKAAKAPSAPKQKNNSRAAEGRREVAENKRPKIREAMCTVMGNNIVNGNHVYEALKDRGWLPNSNEPRTYIGYLLSSMKDTFERIEGRRGYYRVRGTVSPVVETPVVQNNSADDTDAVLQDAGVLPAN